MAGSSAQEFHGRPRRSASQGQGLLEGAKHDQGACDRWGKKHPNVWAEYVPATRRLTKRTLLVHESIRVALAEAHLSHGQNSL